MLGFGKNNIVSQTMSSRRDLKKNTQNLKKLNTELATQMILLASETGNVEDLISAAKVLRGSQKRFGVENTVTENAEVHTKLASTLYAIGETRRDLRVLDVAISEFRHAITLASITNNHALRYQLRKRYAKARDLYAELGGSASTKGVA